MRCVYRFVLLGALIAYALPAAARDEKLSPEDRIQLTRDLTASYATTKVVLPRSKGALVIDTEGNTDEYQWLDAQGRWGTAAEAGDLVQITKIEFEKKRIVLLINGGFRSGRKWWERIEVMSSTGGTVTPANRSAARTLGTKLAIEFPEPIPTLDTDQVKAYLAPVMDFEQRTATEQYMDTLPEPVQAAIEEKRAIEGMDREMVMLALGRPVRKVREIKDGLEFEDWVYGEPPGKITFVTFQGSTVVRIREMYAGVGGSVAPPLEPTR